MSDGEVEHLLAEARANPPAPAAALMARILADGMALQPRPAVTSGVAVAAVAVPPRRGFWRGLAAGFGGSGVLAGLAGVAVLGLALGYTDPSGFADGFLTSTDPGLEMVPAAEVFLNEG